MNGKPAMGVPSAELLKVLWLPWLYSQDVTYHSLTGTSVNHVARGHSTSCRPCGDDQARPAGSVARDEARHCRFAAHGAGMRSHVDGEHRCDGNAARLAGGEPRIQPLPR
jgi:hypothetical protein